ncbi:MAG: hypothetical protein ABF591_13275, partial [Lacticaseibacillus paracasei]|uniref:hypothetical protein n=2 Tax=Lacticaseibacillus paracasei TaxID=1597 RepID=UPI0031D79F33
LRPISPLSPSPLRQLSAFYPSIRARLPMALLLEAFKTVAGACEANANYRYFTSSQKKDELARI